MPLVGRCIKKQDRLVPNGRIIFIVERFRKNFVKLIGGLFTEITEKTLKKIETRESEGHV